jgi:sugar lactone lactonase YvrE
MASELTVLLDGRAFLEGPRWHEGRLWLSDMHTHHVLALDTDGKVETIVEVPNQPSGLGWLPDGRLLIVSMTDRKLLRLEGRKLELHADLSGLASFDCNDMVVDGLGRAYVGNFGFDLNARADFKPAELILVPPDGAARVVADDLRFPNGTVITPDGSTLIVGESFGGRLSAFDIEPDGSLSGRRVWAQLDGSVPDGICLDAEGAIWVSSPVSNEVLRVREGGEITRRIATETQAIACMLGGADRCTLFVLTSSTTEPDAAREQLSARVETLVVDVPGAGYP